MSAPVKLYVYDLSNGMARQLSLQLTGRQIDGIWHTSVVVFGKEIFYGQGISTTQPGKSHHGSPLRIVDMGETAIDEDTFDDYLAAMREHYTADKVPRSYGSRIDFNCNSFTNDCIGFLTGGSIPSYITSLPSDFLSTPFGAALRPTIDAAFTDRPTNGVPARPPPSTASPDPALAASLLQAVAAQATRGGPSLGDARSTPPAPAPAPIASSRAVLAPDAPLAAPMHITTNPASFHSLLRSHRAVVAFFTSATCGPCRMIEPVFKELARSKSRPNGGVGFAKVDLSVGLGGAGGERVSGSGDADVYLFLGWSKAQGGQRARIEDAGGFVGLRSVPSSVVIPGEAISLNPILFTQVPNLDTMFAKLAGFIDGVTSWTGAVTRAQVKQTLSKTVLPFLKVSTATPPAQQPKLTGFDHWPALTSSLAANLGPSELFPLVDIWRIALLNPAFAAWTATKKVPEGPVQRLMDKALQTDDELPRNYLLTVLRMLANSVLERGVGAGGDPVCAGVGDAVARRRVVARRCGGADGGGEPWV
ncbi:hypothetical protein J3R83DRAFT_13083 [Lanmaoa asiatica]|nr:hypothetical protein J3R83DRAFT_13083 [Lanmaoa asiatica]